MKRLISSSIVTIILLALVLGLWGNRMLKRALDAKLAALLTEQLGIAVKLAPVKANILQLSVHSPKLIMGSPGKPALVATDVEVSVDLSDLLNREIRLKHARADDLMLDLSRWPTNDNPWPDDYSFLDPWLPTKLELNTARYVTDGDGDGDDDDQYRFSKVAWLRQSSGAAQLAWTLRQDATAISLSVELSSLAKLLQLTSADLAAKIAVPGDETSAIKLTAALTPGATSGYDLDAHANAAGMAVHLVTGSTSAWTLPASSTTSIDKLKIGTVRKLINSYSAKPASNEAGTAPASSLPQLAFPEHQGKVAIDEIRLNEEVIRDNAFEFTSGEHGLDISSLTANGPAGTLQGQLAVNNSPEGWRVKLAAELTAHEADKSLAADFINADWLWQSGHAHLAGQGANWGQLLNSMEGELSFSGSHRGEVATPINIDARLDNRPGEFALDHIAIALGKGRISGSAAVSGKQTKRLAVNLKAEQLNLDFLFEEQETASLPGVAIPQYLNALPGFEFDWKLDLDTLRMPGMNLSTAQLTLLRTAGQGKLVALVKGDTGGTLDLRVDARMQAGKPSDVSLQAKIAQFGFAELFQQESSLLKIRSSGTISSTSRGKGMEEIFQAMQGKADLTLDIRADDNGSKAGTAQEQLQLAGNAQFVIKGDRITGLQISNLDIDSLKQDLTGTLSMVDGRSPWLVADLKSDKLDIDGLKHLMTKPGETAGQADQLKSIRELGAVHVSLDAKSLILMQETLSNFQLEASSAPDSVTLNRLAFTLAGGHLEGKAAVKWVGDTAELGASATASNFDLDGFLVRDPSSAHVPVSGTVGLKSKGATFQELLANMVGEIDLNASSADSASSPANHRVLKMTARQLADGMEASIDSFEWGNNELSGNVRYHKSVPPMWDVEISDGTVSLLPWENARATGSTSASTSTAEAQTGSLVTRAAQTSAGFLGRMLTAPARLIAGPRESGSKEKLFNTDPLPFDSLKDYRANIKGRLASFTSSVAEAKDLQLAATVDSGQLSLHASIGQLNGGSGEAKMLIDSSVTPPSVKLTGTIEGVYGTSGQDSYPRSGYLSLSSRGLGQAELAANLNGLVYIGLGEGPLNYRDERFLTASVSATMVETLIPGAKKQEPQLQCGATAVIFKDGMGSTPYGFGARTRRANLVGRIALDLKKEMLQLEFDSRSREGLGISVASVFANTVQVKGPLTQPKVVPKTSGLALRGWAAFMTAGLSVVGESVYKRALASDNPCESVNKHIRKEMCSPGQPGAASSMVCPPASPAS